VNRTRFLLTILLLNSAILLANCAIPRATPSSAIGTHLPIPAPPTDTPLPPLPTAELGLAENPLILALPPSANAPQQLAAANEIASQFTERTGYTVVTIVPDSYTALVEAL
jgi:ABC-type phosphate/phosphonate transport system substrate-binding protein